MANCVKCGTTPGMLAFNYAGHTLQLVDKGLQIEPSPLPWQKPTFLCADCVPKVARATCKTHPSETVEFSASGGVAQTRKCSLCQAEKDALAADPALARAKAEADRAKSEAEAASLKAAISKVIVTTGPAPWPHEILGVTSSSGGDAPILGFLMTASRDSAFQKAETQLRANAVQMGGNAVIHCFVEHRIAIAKDLVGSTNQAIEFFGYGTVVRRIEG